MNLQAYSNSYNNPVALVDPDGQYARISRKGNTVSIVMPMLFRNKSSLKPTEFQAKVSAWRSSIEKTWSGKFGNLKVETRVELLSEAEAREIGVQGGGLNVVEVLDEPKTQASETASVWSAPMYDKDEWGDLQYNRKIKGVSEEGHGQLFSETHESTASHEAGHLLGLNHHSDASADRKNIMTTKAQKREPGARPSEAQMNYIVERYCQSGCE